MPRTMTRDEVRDVDRRAIADFGMAGVVLMENAGRGAAELLLSLGVSGEVLIAAGKGNNGGDGFVIARHLDNRGVRVRVVLCCEPEELAGDAAVNFRIIERAGFRIDVLRRGLDMTAFSTALKQSDWIVDALLGTGTQGAIREPYISVINAINESGTRVLAVDLPSGLDCDLGTPLGCAVRAAHTATFVSRKVGFDNPASFAFTGDVHVIDIGVPRALFESKAKA
jgi:NAD(P)H-hydrate epimerase